MVAGTAHVEAEGVDFRNDPAYWAKSAAAAERSGLTDVVNQYGTRIRIETAWGTPG